MPRRSCIIIIASSECGESIRIHHIRHSAIFLRDDQKRDTPPLYDGRAFCWVLIWGVEGGASLQARNCRAIKKRHSKPPKIDYFFLIWCVGYMCFFNRESRTIFYFPRWFAFYFNMCSLTVNAESSDDIKIAPARPTASATTDIDNTSSTPRWILS